MNEPTGYTALDLVGFTDQGEYASNKNYVKNDLVHYQGNTWRCLVDDTMGVQPTEGLNWTLFIGQPSNLVEAIIAPIEETVAIAAHSVGSMLIYSDTLYEVIEPIAIGDTLVDFADDPTNANIKVAPKVEEQIGAIKTDLEDAETNIGKAYKTDDSASTTIQDTDYVPMLEGNTKKKTLWSTIVSKIKSALATVATSGDYNDLINQPTIPTIPGVVSKTANGLAPQLPNETATTKYLRQDGSWQVPPDNNTTYSAGTGTTITGSNNAINVTYGTAANTACQGNDSRLSNKREPTSHASTGTGYGVGNASNYGHVRLSDTYTSSVGAAANSIGASQTALYNAYTALKDGHANNADRATYVWSGAEGTAYTVIYRATNIPLMNMTESAGTYFYDDAGVGIKTKDQSAWANMYAKAFNTMSSRKVKHSISKITESDANKLLNLEPVSFIYNYDKTNTINFGLIAEDVEAIYPSVVTDGPDGKFIDYSKFVPFLIKEIQILKNQIDSVK